MVLKLFLVCIICLISVCILYLAGVLIYSSITEFRPDKKLNLEIEPKGVESLSTGKIISLMTWNIGYGGLGKEMDFFYEGGKMVNPEKNLQMKYISGISRVLSDYDTLDFVLLQEVDFNSKRTYATDESKVLSLSLPGFNMVKAVNYNSRYVPVPYLNPMGKVLSGMLTFSKYKPEGAERLASPGNYSWPKRLFMLKRCFVVTRYKTDSQKELVLINLHNSAYDDADKLRKDELDLLKSILIDEYAKGNYVIAGGDWNQNPPDCDLLKIKNYKVTSVRPMDAGILPAEWKWAYDPDKPTNRNVNEPFDKSTTSCTIIDFFVVSPNINVMGVKTSDLGFENSDHNPVILKISLNKIDKEN